MATSQPDPNSGNTADILGTIYMYSLVLNHYESF